MPTLSSRQLALIGGALGLVVLIWAAFMFGTRPSKNAPNVTLTVWGTDSADDFNILARAYQSIQTNVIVNYKSFPPDQYEAALVNALAAGEGPDAFFVKSHELPGALISPASDTQITLAQVDSLFPKVVRQDFAADGKVNAMPLYLDTLALVYNRKIFDRSGVISPPATWDDFANLVKDLRVLNDQGRVQKAGAAIGGTSKSIENASDILESLLLQNGTVMIDGAQNNASFANADGIQAMNFYTQFGDSSGPYFTWDESGDALQSFASERTAMIFAYNEQVRNLKNKNPFLEIGVAPLPQVSSDNPVVFAEYDGLAVSKQSKNKEWGWDFAIRSATAPSILNPYLAATKRSPALRSLLATAEKSATLGVFAKQSLIARSWYDEDRSEISDIFDTAIGKVLAGSATAKSALEEAQNQVSGIIKQRK